MSGVVNVRGCMSGVVNRAPRFNGVGFRLGVIFFLQQFNKGDENKHAFHVSQPLFALHGSAPQCDATSHNKRDKSDSWSFLYLLSPAVVQETKDQLNATS